MDRELTRSLLCRPRGGATAAYGTDIQVFRNLEASKNAHVLARDFVDQPLGSAPLCPGLGLPTQPQTPRAASELEVASLLGLAAHAALSWVPRFSATPQGAGQSS